MYLIKWKWTPKTSLLHSSVDIQILHEFFKSVTSAHHISPAGWTSPNPGSADSTHKVPPAALMDLGLSSELLKTNLKKAMISMKENLYHYYQSPDTLESCSEYCFPWSSSSNYSASTLSHPGAGSSPWQRSSSPSPIFSFPTKYSL